MKLNAAIYAKTKNDLVEAQKKRIGQLETQLKGMNAINGANLDRLAQLEAEIDAVLDAAAKQARIALDGALYLEVITKEQYTLLWGAIKLSVATLALRRRTAPDGAQQTKGKSWGVDSPGQMKNFDGLDEKTPGYVNFDVD